MRRLQNLAHEALTWPHLGEKQQLVWAAVLELGAVPFQELLDDSHVCPACTLLYISLYIIVYEVRTLSLQLMDVATAGWDGRSCLRGSGSARTAHVDIQAGQ